jgi:hypothetical protein
LEKDEEKTTMSKFVENYEIKPKVLGSGMYGNVHLGEHT